MLNLSLYYWIGCIVFKILSLIQYFNMIWGLIEIMIIAYFMVMSHLIHIPQHSKLVEK